MKWLVLQVLFAYVNKANIIFIGLFCYQEMDILEESLDLIVLLAQNKFVFFSQVPSKPPERIIAESHVTLTTIPVTWQPIDSSYIHGILLGYKIRYQAVAIGEEPVEDQPIREEIVNASTSFLVLKNLEIFTLYRIDVLGYTIMGNGPPATDYAGLSNFQTHQNIICFSAQHIRFIMYLIPSLYFTADSKCM